MLLKIVTFTGIVCITKEKLKYKKTLRFKYMQIIFLQIERCFISWILGTKWLKKCVVVQMFSSIIQQNWSWTIQLTASTVFMGKQLVFQV